jgi:proline iminopeptidase
MSDYDLRSELSGIHVPTMIMVGTHDWVTPISQSRYLAKHIPGAKLVVFHESGHMVYIDENEKFLRNMKQFLKLK